ncbi:hypothetical protein RLDS_11725 [Sphingobium lactosutens DS20]|uniref:Uncharacterized protein n=2 Tax=Sphingobium TaxID=165695 RepID=A0A0S3EXD1_9SPHN|nr:hypothetical protein ATN00_06905 [Sphingobium baderi]EQB14830.1 hypothetical protein RLDS_11725 [Sphingobium lactosutens DS20]
MGPVHRIVGRARRLDDAGILDRNIFLSGFYGLPEFVIQDPQMRHVSNDPLGLRIDTGDTLAGLGVLQVAQAVPDQLADIQLIIDQACSTLCVTPNRSRCPELAGRCGYPRFIEAAGNRMRTETIGKLAEHLPDNFRFSVVDGALAVNCLTFAGKTTHDVIAVAKAAAGLAFLDASAKATMGLLGKILEEEGVHRALQADMQFRNLALGQGHDLHARELKVLV